MTSEDTKFNSNTNEAEETVESVFAEEVVAETGEPTSTMPDFQAKLDEAENRYLRLQADFDNFRRRTRLDAEASQKYRAQAIVTDLLPVLDNFERAIQTQVDQEQAKSLLQGMEMVYRLLQEALKNEGVEPIEAVGKLFDPHLHQAVMQVETEDSESGMILEEFQKGYKLKDRVIRPSMVKVSQ
jgi:molecular chaperone GrpE